MSRSIFAVLLLISIVSTTPNARADEPQWFKGNIHTHSLWSDGDDFPEMIALWYRDNGYHFLAISDHNILSRGEKWIELKDIEKRGGKGAVERCIERFGDDWVVLRGEADERAVKLKTLEEFRPRVEKDGEFILLEGEEISDKYGKLPIHINATNVGELVKPQGGSSVSDVIRRNVIAVREQAERLGRDILVHLNHPNFHYAVTAEDIATVTEERFFEVYNGHPTVYHLGDELHASVERIWDIANTLRVSRFGAAPLYGVATDDAHDYHGPKGAVTGRGWVQVRAASLEPKALIEAMERGDFYASSGVVLEKISFDEETKVLSVSIRPDSGAEYVTRFVGTREGWDETSEEVVDKEGNAVANTTRRYSRDVGEVLAVSAGTNPSYQLRGDELYVRAVVTSSLPAERPVFDGQKMQAWTQPVGWKERIEKASTTETTEASRESTGAGDASK